jgi:hypothetical protein
MPSVLVGLRTTAQPVVRRDVATIVSLFVQKDQPSSGIFSTSTRIPIQDVNDLKGLVPHRDFCLYNQTD